MDSKPNDGGPSSGDPTEIPLIEKAETLIWSLLDDQIDEAQAKELESMMEQNPPVRERYIQCVQMHCDLQNLFNPSDSPPAELPKSPVLGSLGDLRPGTDTLPLRD